MLTTDDELYTEDTEIPKAMEEVKSELKMGMSEVWSQEPCFLINQPPTTQSATSNY